MALCLISCLSGLCVFICVFCFVLFFLESAVWPSDLKRILNCQFNLPKTGGAWKPGPHWHTANLIQIDFGFKSKKVKKLLWVSPSCPQNKRTLLCWYWKAHDLWALISAASVSFLHAHGACVSTLLIHSTCWPYRDKEPGPSTAASPSDSPDALSDPDLWCPVLTALAQMTYDWL